MKFNQKKAKDIATLGVSAVVGTKVSKGATAVLPSSVKNPATHAGLGIIALLAASMIPGKGFGAEVGRGLAIGVGINQVDTAINSVVAPMLPVADSQAKLLLSAAFDKPAAGLNGSFSIPEGAFERTAYASTGSFAGI